MSWKEVEGIVGEIMETIKKGNAGEIISELLWHIGEAIETVAIKQYEKDNSIINYIDNLSLRRKFYDLSQIIEHDSDWVTDLFKEIK